MNTVKPDLHHLIKIENLDRTGIEYLLDKAHYFLEADYPTLMQAQSLAGKVVTTLFFEPSTRTRNSFILAAQKLGAIVLSPEISNSSVKKGESLLDTVQSFEAMGTSIFIVRHNENHSVEFISSHLRPETKLINAGDGSHRHPTQALLDLLTIRQHKPNFSDLRVAIIGDIKHSRVARSAIQALTMMNVKEIRLIAHCVFLPETLDYPHVKTYSVLEEGLEDVDVVMTLRVQKERIIEGVFPDMEGFISAYKITPENIKAAKPDAIVMHPGPMNRGIEIDSAVADGPQSVILQQVQNGVAMRMAILDTVQ
jgi:aspartate carbamoyltransferase catalytic subunit